MNGKITELLVTTQLHAVLTSVDNTDDNREA